MALFYGGNTMSYKPEIKPISAESIAEYISFLEQRIKENLPKEIPFTGNKGIKFQDVKKNPELLEKFVAQLGSKNGLVGHPFTPFFFWAFRVPPIRYDRFLSDESGQVSEYGHTGKYCFR